MIAYILKKGKKYLTNPYLRGTQKFSFTYDILMANKWSCLGWAKIAEKRIRAKGFKVKIVVIEVKEIIPPKKVKKPINNLIL